MNRRATPLSVSLISGLPGSGKSTLLQGIVSAPGFSGTQTALIINDVGPLQLSARAFRGSALEVIALNGGCACCVKGDEMIQTVNRFAKDPHIEQVWIEASGQALTESLIERFKGVSLSKWAEIRQIVHVVDAEKFFMPSNSFEAQAAQVRPASFIFLNKTDLASAEACREMRETLKTWNPVALFLESIRGEVDLSLLVGQPGR